jgi:hypothetical protein
VLGLYSPPDKNVNEMLEERRKELLRLIEGALRYIGVDSHDVSIVKRKKVDPVLKPEDVAFIAKSLQNMNYNVKRIEHRDKRLLLFV